MNQTTSNCVAIVLAGGEAKRLGGADKGLVLYKGKPLIHHVLERLENQVETVLISANRHIDDYESYGTAVIRDQSAETYEGPMAGLIACLAHLSKDQNTFSDWQSVLVCSCDTPKLPLDLSSRLHKAIKNHHDASIAVAHDGQRGQALHCLIKRSACDDLVAAFNEGERSLNRWQQQNNAIYVDYSAQPELFLNINTAAELEGN